MARNVRALFEWYMSRQLSCVDMFVNTLPYISNPIKEFKDYHQVSWNRDIYPQFRGVIDPTEIAFYVDLIKERHLVDIVDLGLGGGQEISGIIEACAQDEYSLHSHEGNEVSEDFIIQSSALFYRKKQEVLIHRANWIELPHAEPVYDHDFDFAFLTGNSLTYIGGGTREYTKLSQAAVVSKFARLIRPGGYLFIDTRDYDYIRSLMHLPADKILEEFKFPRTPYYKGTNARITVFPAYISDTVVVLHYYDTQQKVWAKLDLYPIYGQDMRDILSRDFTIEKVYRDFEEGTKEKSLFVQYLAKRK